jgi:hypothetical protein
MKQLLKTSSLTLISVALLVACTLPSRADEYTPSLGFYKEVVRRLPSHTSGTIDDLYYEIDQMVTFLEGDKLYWGIKVDTWPPGGNGYDSGLLLCTHNGEKFGSVKDIRGLCIIDVLELGAKEVIDSYYMQHGTVNDTFGTLVFASNHYGEQKVICAYHGKWRVLLYLEDTNNRMVIPGFSSYDKPPGVIVEIGLLVDSEFLSDLPESEGNSLLQWLVENKIGYPAEATSWQVTSDSLLYLQYYPSTGSLYAYKLRSGGTTYGLEEAPEPEELEARF